MAGADGEELLPAFSNNSLSSDMSFSEGDNSNLLLPPVLAGNVFPRDNEPVALPPPANVVANGLQNIIQAYQSDDEEPNVLHEQNVVAAIDAEDLPVQVIASQMQQMDDINLARGAEEDLVPSSEPGLAAQVGVSSEQAIQCRPVHINTSRGGLEPVTNIENLQSGLQGNWVNQINEHFSMAPSLLGLKCIQLAATANNDHTVSEEGLLLWKKHFQEESVDNKNSFYANIPVSWFNFIVHLLLTPDKFD